jgi:hypothetical protein
MRTVYKVIAYIIAAEVALQAMFVVFGIAGLSHWVEGGGVLDKAVLESDQSSFPEEVGFMLHSLNGGIIIPVLGLVLLILSFFAKVSGGVKWAALVFLLAFVQVNLGFALHDIPALGALHGLNALLLLAAAFYTGRRSRVTVPTPVAEVSESVETSA